MGRGPRRRRVKSEDEESEDEALTPMSPNTQKANHLKMIQRMDLGEDNADAIKTSDYSNRGRQFNPSSIVRECHVAGTEAARIAKENQGATSKWLTFGQSDEAIDDLFTQRQISNGNSHRHNVKEAKREEEARLGHKLSLEDTYNDHGGGRRAGMRVTSLPSRLAAAAAAAAPFTQTAGSTRPFATAPNNSEHAKRGKAVAARPWPPPALEGTPSMARALQIAQPSAKIVTPTMTAMCENRPAAAAASDSKRRALTLPAKQGFNLVEDSSQFMSSIKSKLATWSQDKPTEAQETSASAANADPATLAAAPSTEPAPQVGQASEHLHDPSIRRIPIAEFSFSVAHALAPANVSTHTDGEPSPGALSGFSTSITDGGESSTQLQAVTDDLIGLGIEDGTLSVTRSMSQVPGRASPLSTSGSILDSPILDQVSSKVLPTEVAKVVIIGGHRYVLESEVLSLKDTVQTKVSSTTTSVIGDSQVSDPASKAAALPQPSEASSTVASSINSTAVPTFRAVNPFAPREPLATNDTNIAASQGSVSTVTKDLKGPSTAAKPATRASSVVTSKTTVISKWADEPSSRSTNWPTAHVVRPSSPIFGDRKVFGHLSQEASESKNYEPPPPPPPPDTKPPTTTTTTKRKYEPMGPGLAMLLQDIADAERKKADAAAAAAPHDSDEEL
ncbi:hypothetical protein AYL99_11397 [Fonsecaea erecta]|uniref:Uncharacterized protein n=1 Tax=Fonsecaea erecta TaxID=1367422 RepID=A0A178Z478_9EURO|nr:hypothetical protein AYL99_11397 [Fonsecaea erecta]OAP54296.1 hypothetical protein AYL99_11397 [Fonsecaea erecta]